MKTPDQWRKVRIVPGSTPGLWSIVHYFSHMRIMAGAKKLLDLDDLQTDDIQEDLAVYVGQKFEDGFRRLDEATKKLAHQERESRRKG